MLSVLLAFMTAQVATPGSVDPAVATAPLPLVELGPFERRDVEAEAIGHTGEVVAEIVVQPDGTRGPAALVRSSRSHLLDAEALRLVTEAGFRPPAEATRYRVTVSFPGADEHLTCAAMARQVRWFQQTWPERPLQEMALYSMSSGLLLVAGAPEQPTRSSAQAAVDLMDRLKGDFETLAEQCEREPDRAWYPLLGDWARRQRAEG